MTTNQSPDSGDRLGSLQVITLILSVYVLIALVAQTFFHLAPEIRASLDHVDFWVCLIFLADFFIRLHQAPSKPGFLKWGWIDFVSSIPMMDWFRIGRVVRVIRIFRNLRAFRSSKNLLNYLLRERRATSFSAVASISFVLVVFASISILQFETSPDANIKTPVDAFWWAYVTITTVGYGDKFPLSIEGRIVACILMTAGVGLFGTFTGFIASLFVSPEAKEEEPEKETEIQVLTREIRTLRTQIQSLEARFTNTNRTG